MTDTHHPGAPEAAPMPEARPDRSASTDGPPDRTLAVGGMTDYPAGRGGMVAGTMPGSSGAVLSAPEPLSPIGDKPDAIDMASADLPLVSRS